MTQNAISGYELLLNCFGSDPIEAGRLLQLQRDKIIAFFDFKGSGIIDGERLADEVLDIAIKNLQNGEPIRNIRSYLYGTAKLVLCNYYREVDHDQRKLEEYQYLLKAKPLSADEGDEKQETLRMECNHRCLEQLDSANRELLNEYYSRSSPEARQVLSQRCGISRNYLTIRVYRLCAGLRKCQGKCMKKKYA